MIGRENDTVVIEYRRLVHQYEKASSFKNVEGNSFSPLGKLCKGMCKVKCETKLRKLCVPKAMEGTTL